MKAYGVNELRKMFLEFFESKGHLRMNSFSLIPHNDNSLLLINSGMAPLKPYFTGQEIPPRRRVTTCQKCIRTGDIENIGKTARHGTFFEMLGNFSFGDYFKKEAIPWAWEFLTEKVGIDKDRLYPSVYVDDDEAYRIWHEDMGIAPERIFKFGKEDNFWEHGSGPCGPCSEIYYDRGEKYGCGKPTCTVGCDCDRYMEVWNIVFSQFDNDGHGNYSDLIQKNIDTGMGLERLAVVCQDVDSLFDVDTVKSLRDHVCRLAGVEYETDPKKDMSIRLITDHIRSVTFMASDGIMPSNEGRGYVLRRLLRRAARHGRLLGISGRFLAELAQTVIEGSRDGYPELEEKRAMILKVITQEENNFNAVIDQGLEILSDLEAAMTEKGETVLNGDDAFRLYDTYGFPLDLTKEILEEKGFSVDEDGFKRAMEVQRTTARAARKTTNYMGADATIYDELDPEITSTFVGYDRLTHESRISVMTTKDAIVDELTQDQEGTIIVDETPFYGTMGGQMADTGIISTTEATFVVTDTIHLKGGKIGHVGYVEDGRFSTGETVTLTVDEARRSATCKNHSATHLLQKALRQVLGTHVEQAGSLVDQDHLRFDFTHFQAMTAEELREVEDLVNREIAANLPVNTSVMTMEEAKKTGAMALFGEKYGESVRVVNMGDFSIELCGGTHVANTGVISAFKILSESGIAAGVRRIEALTSDGVFAYYRGLEAQLADLAKACKCDPSQLKHRIETLQDELKAARSENEKLKNKLASSSMGDVMNQVQEIGGVKLLAVRMNDVAMNELRTLGDQLKEKLGEGVVVLASGEGSEKASLIVTATEGAMKAGAHAGNLIKAIAGCVGGGGGGRPNMAQAGGKNPAGIDEALKKAAEVLKTQLS
ncbi:MAG: alanine--tRNA ligase [Lachnospiraceae bacterium]|nr:alanine--tRNA ligase [Lachnospiraceae bacterium]